MRRWEKLADIVTITAAWAVSSCTHKALSNADHNVQVVVILLHVLKSLVWRTK